MANEWRALRRFPTRKHLRVRFNQLRTDVMLKWRKRGHRGGWERGAGRAGFVVGCQRSGTDMVLWTLDKSMDVDRYDENQSAAFRDCRIKDREVWERLIRCCRGKRVIFKPVCDSHRTAQLLGEHEDSRAVWVYRDFRDVANSAVQRWAEMNLKWVQDVARGGGAWGRRQWNRELLTPARQEQVEAFCQDDLTPHGAAAIFWYLLNSTLFDQQLESNERVTLARYEDLVSKPTDEFQRLCGFFEIEFTEEMVASIFTSSVRRRSKAPISAAVTEACEELLVRLDRVHAEQES